MLWGKETHCKMRLSGTLDGFHHRTKWNTASYISEYQFWACQKKFQFQVGKRRRWGFLSSFCLASHRTPPNTTRLPTTHFHSHPARCMAIHQDPGRGHLPPAHKCMEQGNKINLVAIVFPPIWWPRVSSSVTTGEGIKKGTHGCTRNYGLRTVTTAGWRCLCVNGGEIMPVYGVKTPSISV